MSFQIFNSWFSLSTFHVSMFLDWLVFGLSSDKLWTWELESPYHSWKLSMATSWTEKYHFETYLKRAPLFVFFKLFMFLEKISLFGPYLSVSPPKVAFSFHLKFVHFLLLQKRQQGLPRFMSGLWTSMASSKQISTWSNP